MTSYAAPIRDLQFLLHDVFRISESGLPGHDELDRDFTGAVLEAAGVTGDSYYAMLADPALPSLYGAAGQIIDEHGAREDASAAALEETMELLYYDRVYGENHSRAMDAGSGEGAR